MMSWKSLQSLPPMTSHRSSKQPFSDLSRPYTVSYLYVTSQTTLLHFLPQLQLHRDCSARYNIHPIHSAMHGPSGRSPRHRLTRVTEDSPSPSQPTTIQFLSRMSEKFDEQEKERTCDSIPFPTTKPHTGPELDLLFPLFPEPLTNHADFRQATEPIIQE